MIFPKHLQPGDTVALVAPAFPLTKDKTERCVKALEALGLKVKLGENLLACGPAFGAMEAELKQREAEKAALAKQSEAAQTAAGPGCNAAAEKTDAAAAAQKLAEGLCAAALSVFGLYGGKPEPELKACVEQRALVRGYLEGAYLGGDPKKRADDINRMFADPEVKAILCGRGGYGSAQIMPYLDYELIAKHPKIFAGFSDITNLLNAFSQKCGFVTFHAPMVATNLVDQTLDDYTKNSYVQTLFADWEEIDFQNPLNYSMQTLAGGKAAGRLVGGNVTVLARTCGTFYQPDTRNAILFLEDVGEEVSSIDMYLTQMENAGLFAQVKGVLLGDFNDCGNRYNPSFAVGDMLRARFAERGIPVLAQLRSGHEVPMGTLPVGAWCEMDADVKTVRFYRH